MTAILGQVLLWLGFLAAAFATAYRLELPGENKWPTIWWALYGGGMAIGVVGVVLLRSERHADRTHAGRVATGLETLKRSLQQLTEQLDVLAELAESRRPSAVVHHIDDQCATLFSEFADARQALVQQYNLDVFAEVMSSFASAERFVNRAWSAAADGYIEEAIDSIAKGRRFLAAASKAMTEAEALG